jgi:SAM-dependent methyltransferase
MSDWPGATRRNPSAASATYAVRAPLARWLEREGADAAGKRVLDVGCGVEHCDDPAQAVRELRRAVSSGGRVLASTHGVQVYHPSPNDLWRWTHAGLERLFRENGDWAELEVRPGAGTTACLGMLLTHTIELLAGRAHLRSAVRPLVWGVNRAAEAIDDRVESLREPIPGTIFANYHVVAVAP